MTKKEIIKNIFGELSNKRHIAEIVAQKNKKLALENVEYSNLEIKDR